MGYLDKALKSIKDKTVSGNDTRVPLDTRTRILEKTLIIHSQTLDEFVCLVSNEEMARRVEDEGMIAYTPEEITILSRASKTKNQEEWIDFLKKMHMVKKTFSGSRIQA
jgi:hypothetical protein